MFSNIVIAKATAADLDDASKILTDATLWMQSKGFDNWHPEWWTVKEMETFLNQGELHMARINKINVGVFCLMENDPEVWPEKENIKDAYYIHRLAVAQNHRGTGLPALIIDWCKSAAREDGKSFLRLDCVDGSRLIDFYRQLGFEPEGTTQWRGEGYPDYNGRKMELRL